MEAFVRSSLALRRARKAGSQKYQTVITPIVIEVTSTEGETASREVITPTRASAKKPFQLPSILSSYLDTLAYHVHTIALFSYSDAKTVLLPWTLFGLAHALSAGILGLTYTPSTLNVLIRTPQVMAWLYLNLTWIAIGNQNSATAIMEDGINKSWRPLPAKRITPTQAFYLQNVMRLISLLFALRYGGLSQFIILNVLSFAYNDMSLSDKSVIARHVLNGLAFISFGAGAMEAALARGFIYSNTLTVWLRIIAVIVIMGVQAADLYDQEGDRVAERRTLPLVIGDKAARWCLALPVLAWSFFCPYFWDLGFMGYVLPVLGGVVVAKRTLTKRDVVADRKTYKIWNLWLVVIYCLPLVKCISTAVFA